MIDKVKNLENNERLAELGLWTLEERRNRTDLIEVYKMMNGMSTIPYDRFFKLDDSRRTRGHSLKLVKRRFTTTIRQHFFSERVVNTQMQLT